MASDHLGNAEIITSELLTLAHGDVAFLAGHEEIPSIQDRIRGFLRACRDAGIADANKRVLAVKDDRRRRRPRADGPTGWQAMRRHRRRFCAPRC